MEYFIKFPGDTKKDLEHDHSLLGSTNQWGVFWGGPGLNMLSKLSNEKREDILEQLTIIDSHGKKYTILQFLALLNNFESVRWQ